MKEKRYEIFKRGELENRNPEGINALKDEPDDFGGLPQTQSRYVNGSPRSKLNRNFGQSVNNVAAQSEKNTSSKAQRSDNIPSFLKNQTKNHK